MAAECKLADPAVSRAKFDREISEYRALEAEYRGRGWLLVEAEFPTAVFVLAAAHIKPAPVVFGVRFDFSDYDLLPLDVTLVDPFTREPYRAKELPTVLPRLVGAGGVGLRQEAVEAQVAEALGAQGAGGAGGVPIQMEVGQLMMSHDPEEVPFICLPGVRAYHDHPAHTGDSWMLHRPRGTGRMSVLLEHLHRFGVQNVTGYAVQVGLETAGWQPPGPFRIHAQVVGFDLELRPE
ncbi:putative metal-binding protein [Longimicrobium sp.]|uniref:putative metal-binding protein n=1 Tax=Longimicrobium sp. TaxID=2029185 RepID=UPI003B3ADAC2